MTTSKIYRRGTHRSQAPEATLARVRPFMAAMGITRIANITGLDNIGIPVVMVCRPNSRSLAVAQGKGLDLAAAKASGLMEAVEIFHAERINKPVKYANAIDLGREHNLIDIAGLAFSRQAQYHDEHDILWIAGHDLMQEQERWLPFELVSTDYTIPSPPGSGCFAANTNGLASGNHQLEAISHAICEVIERDASTLWQLQEESQRQQKTLVDIRSINDPACRQILQQLAAADIDVRVWDVTSDIGVATFTSLIVGRDEQSAHPEFGTGCHLVREIALLRALTEAAQARTTYIAGTRDDIGPAEYEPESVANRLHACRALLEQNSPGREFCTVPSQQTDSFEDDIACLLERLQVVGIEQVVVVDLSQERFQIPVVRVVIPGLEGAYKGPQSDYVTGVRAKALLAE